MFDRLRIVPVEDSPGRIRIEEADYSLLAVGPDREELEDAVIAAVLALRAGNPLPDGPHWPRTALYTYNRRKAG